MILLDLFKVSLGAKYRAQQQKRVTPLTDLVRSTQTEGSPPPTRHPITTLPEPPNVRVFDQSEGAARSRRGQRVQIKCLTCIHPFNPRKTVSDLLFDLNSHLSLTSATGYQPTTSPCLFNLLLKETGEGGGGGCREEGGEEEEEDGPLQQTQRYFCGIKKRQTKAASLKLLPDRESGGHDSACRRFTENDATDSSPELPAGGILSGR